MLNYDTVVNVLVVFHNMVVRYFKVVFTLVLFLGMFTLGDDKTR